MSVEDLRMLTSQGAYMSADAKGYVYIIALRECGEMGVMNWFAEDEEDAHDTAQRLSMDGCDAWVIPLKLQYPG